MATKQLHRLKTISEYHKLVGLPMPGHPLISVVNFNDIWRLPGNAPLAMVFDFYAIAVKRSANARMKYGQQDYDFNEGIMFFMAPNQVFGIETKDGQPLRHSGWMLLIHPDFFWNTPLAKKITQYDFFSYSVHEALHLSEKEEATVTGIMSSMEQEYQTNIDTFTQTVIIAQLELLLTYGERFYQRQFITRKIANHRILNRLEEILDEYFNSDTLAQKGIPTVQHVAESLNVSPNYLSGLLKVLTGQSTQQHIHNKLIEKAKEKLSVTELTVSEIAYELGFEHSQSFSKLFKSKTHVSPLEFRNAFQ